MRIREVGVKKGLDSFIDFPSSLYAKDPLFVPLLRREARLHFSPANPFFKHADVAYFIADRAGETVGRVAAIIDHRHIEFQQEKTGFFGFFEAIEDQEVCSILLDTAAARLRAGGMKAMRGPMNFSTNEECGFLIEGFALHPMLMTPYNPAYYATMMEQYGMGKAKDLYAFIYERRDHLPEKVLRVAALAERKGIRVRPVDKGRFHEEMGSFKEVYNDAWEKNWGFVPLTDDELNYLGSRLKSIVVPDLTLIAEDKGGPVGFMGLLPDFNFVLKHMAGKLNPLTILKALYYSRKITDLRLLLLGIKKEYRNRGVDALLFREGFKGIHRGGYRRVEFSWVLEDNIPVQRIIDMVGGRLYKKYRIYEKRI